MECINKGLHEWFNLVSGPYEHPCLRSMGMACCFEFRNDESADPNYDERLLGKLITKTLSRKLAS